MFEGHRACRAGAVRVYAMRVAAAAALLLLPAAAFAGPDWVERGDAGSTLSTAQVTAGVGTIRSIIGTLQPADRGNGDLEDLYLIRIAQPTTFSFSISAANFSPTLYLFNISLAGEAFGLLGKRADGAGAITLGGTATDGTGAQVTQPGVYMLCVTYEGNVPRSRTGNIFNFTTEGETSGPDGAGGLNPIENWTPSQPLVGGSYDIDMTGVEFADIPSPGSAALVCGAGVLLMRRRRGN
jgi:hypothetical protein